MYSLEVLERLLQFIVQESMLNCYMVLSLTVIFPHNRDEELAVINCSKPILVIKLN